MKAVSSSAAVVCGLAAAAVCWAGETTGQTGSEQCCGALAREPALAGKVFGPDDDSTTTYADRLASYYSANAALRPWCMVLPLSTADVSRAAELLHANACPFGMRGGAHSAFAGSNGVEDGVTVDFGYMNATTYDAATNVASVQAGANWQQVYEALDGHGATAVGGRASPVGVAGFLTGGGYSFLSSAKGLGCDAVRGFEVVLANGTVVYASAAAAAAGKGDHADLFRAQKGGSGNFGFVTRFDLEAVKNNKLWAGFVGYAPSELDKYFNAYIDFVENMGSDPDSQVVLGMTATPDAITHTSILSNSQGVPDKPIFADWLAISNISSTVRTGTYKSIVPEFSGPTPKGLYANWMVEMYANDVRMLHKIDASLTAYRDRMVDAAPASNFSILLELQPVTETIVSQGAANGGNALGLEAVLDRGGGGPAMMFLISLTADTRANQDLILPLALEFRDEVRAYAAGLGLDRDWVYAPYAYADQEPLSHYGAANIRLMHDVSARYDPEGAFQKLRRSGFKIPAVA